jgi:UDP-glucose 4-epimerase
MKIIVTGGAGFIGSHIVDGLINRGNEVCIIDNLSTGSKENINPKAKFYKTDVQDKEISEIFEKEKPDIVFHLAAQINVRESVKNPTEDAKINILGSLNILENCKKSKVKKIIFASTGGAIYGEADIIPTPENYAEFPLSPYGIAKLAVEKYINYYSKNFGLPFTALRFGNVYGPRQNPEGEAGVISIFCDKFLKKEQPVINGDGKQTRDFVFVEDVADACLMFAENNKTGIFNIATGKETDINEIFDKVKEITGSDYQKAYGTQNAGEQKRSCLDCSKAKNEAGWEAKYSVEEGLIKTVNWFKKKYGK